MKRCLQLAVSAAGNVAPNPMVGAVLVHDGLVIGEGFHQHYGEAHAEVNCLNSVPEAQKQLIKESTLYVSLEPCNHFGKTGPCSDLIIKSGITKVVIATLDPFEKVNGSGADKLRAAGVTVVIAVLEKEAIELNKRFFTAIKKQRPYIILKWAQSHDLKIAGENHQPLKISNEITDRLVHKWRTEEAAIMVGTNTALTDNPFLTARLWPGNDPVRVVLDSSLRLPATLNLFNGTVKTICLNTIKKEESGNIHFYKYEKTQDIPIMTAQALMQHGLISLIVEGGQKLLQSFIDAGLWDEARVITNHQLLAVNGMGAPVLKNARLVKNEFIRTDEISYFENNSI